MGGDGEKASPRRGTQARPPGVYILEAFGCHVTMCRMCTFDAPPIGRYIAAVRNAPSTRANPASVSHTQEGLMKRLLACSPLAVALALAGCDGTATAPRRRPLWRGCAALERRRQGGQPNRLQGLSRLCVR